MKFVIVYKKLSEEDKIIIKYLGKSLVMGPKESLWIILKKIGVFVMWATCLKKLMKQVTFKGEKDQGDLKVAGLKIISMQAKS